MTRKLLGVLIIISSLMAFYILYTENTEAKSNYTIVYETFTQDGTIIQYPQIIYPDDLLKEKAINEMIKEDIVQNKFIPQDELYAKDGIRDIYVSRLDCEVTMSSPELLSVLYTGEYIYYTGRPVVESYAYQASDIHSITIDIQSIKKVELSDLVSIDSKLVKKIKESTDITNPLLDENTDKTQEPLSKVSKDELISIVSEMKEDHIINGLREGSAYYTFAIARDSLIISVPIAHALGGYALIRVPFMPEE